MKNKHLAPPSLSEGDEQKVDEKEIQHYLKKNYCDHWSDSNKGNKQHLKKMSIYDEDNRFGYCPERKVFHQEVAGSIALLTKIDKLKKKTLSSGEVGYSTQGNLLQNLLKGKPCTSFSFFNEVSLGFCTGFLIDHDLLLTAGHCINPVNFKESAAIFTLMNDEEIFVGEKDHRFRFFKNKQVFFFKELLFYLQDNQKGDLALLKLDRPHLETNPFILDDGEVTSQDIFWMVGHPLGLRLKFSPGRYLGHEGNFWYSNFDSFQGNSGSPVLLNHTNRVYGVLVRGQSDFIYDQKDDCYHLAIFKSKRRLPRQTEWLLSAKRILQMIKLVR